MFDFENKPIQDWTLAECKNYCKNTHHKGCCTTQEDSAKYCILAKNNICRFSPACYGFTPPIPHFSSDEIAFCRLIKKTYPWGEYIVKGESGGLRIFEKTPVVNGFFVKSQTPNRLF